MSTKEQLMQELDTLTETQLKALLLFIHSFQTESSIPNEETAAALKEVSEMKQHPERYPGYTDVDTMNEEQQCFQLCFCQCI